MDANDPDNIREVAEILMLKTFYVFQIHVQENNCHARQTKFKINYVHLIVEKGREIVF
jgi:hypothetical protein